MLTMAPTQPPMMAPMGRPSVKRNRRIRYHFTPYQSFGRIPYVAPPHYSSAQGFTVPAVPSSFPPRSYQKNHSSNNRNINHYNMNRKRRNQKKNRRNRPRSAPRTCRAPRNSNTYLISQDDRAAKMNPSSAKVTNELSFTSSDFSADHDDLMTTFDLMGEFDMYSSTTTTDADLFSMSLFDTEKENTLLTANDTTTDTDAATTTADIEL